MEVCVCLLAAGEVRVCEVELVWYGWALAECGVVDVACLLMDCSEDCLEVCELWGAPREAFSWDEEGEFMWFWLDWLDWSLCSLVFAHQGGSVAEVV